MNIQIFGFLGIIILLLVIFAEATKSKKALGVIAGLLLIMLGLWVYSDGIQIQTGQVTTKNINEFHDITPAYDNVTITGNETITYVMSDITLEWITFNEVMGLFLILFGVFGVIFYALM